MGRGLTGGRCVIYLASENYTLELVTLISRDEKITRGLFGTRWGLGALGPSPTGSLDKMALPERESNLRPVDRIVPPSRQQHVQKSFT